MCEHKHIGRAEIAMWLAKCKFIIMILGVSVIFLERLRSWEFEKLDAWVLPTYKVSISVQVWNLVYKAAPELSSFYSAITTSILYTHQLANLPKHYCEWDFASWELLCKRLRVLI